MKRSIVQASSALAVALSVVASSSVALAQPPASSSPPSTMPPRDVITYEESMPNGSLIGSGLTMFGASYLPSLVVAASSDRAGDTALYIPVVGPWIDLGQRDSRCPGSRCVGDAANKVLLVVDGVFQGLGALQVLGGFVFPTTRTVTQLAGVRVLPTVGSSQVGLTAVGSF